MKVDRNKIKMALILGIMCAFLTGAIVVQIKTVNNSSTTVGKTQTENELRDSVLRWKQKYENAVEKLSDEEDELNNLREKASSDNSSSSNQNIKLQMYDLLLGKKDVVGPGIIITLNDGDSSLLKTQTTDYIVHDSDILEVINALRNAGAEAISVNNQRIVYQTAIECVGNVVIINGEKIGAPFTIKATGLTAQLYGALTIPGGYIELLENAGVKVNIEQVEKSTITIPKYEGVYKLEYASNIE